MRPRVLRLLEQSLWRTWCQSWRSPGGSSCWSKLGRLWTTSLINWWVACSPLNHWNPLCGALPYLVRSMYHPLGSPAWGRGYHHRWWQLWVQRYNSRWQKCSSTVNLNDRKRSHAAPVLLSFSGVVRVLNRKGCCSSAAESVVGRKGRAMDPRSCRGDTRRPGEISQTLWCFINCQSWNLTCQGHPELSWDELYSAERVCF